MIPGIIASTAATTVSWSLNFATGVYRSRGSSVDIATLIDHPEDIGADGLAIGLVYPVAILGDLLAYLLAGNWTIVIDWVRTDDVYCEPFRIADAADNNPRLGVQDDAGDFLAYELVIGDRDLPLSGTVGALAHSVIALTRTNDHIAISRNGDAVLDNPTNGPVPLAMTAAWFGGGPFDGTPISFGECTIRRFVVMAPVDNVFLPGLSVLAELPPASVTGTLVGTVTPVGSFAGTFAPAGVSGALVGSVTPVGSFAGTFTPQAVTGALAGSVAPTGSMTGTFTVAAPWTPADLSSSVLKAWFKADDAASITASSGAVSQWNDKSGNGNHVTAAGALRPTTGTQTINSKNVLDFSGANNLSKTSGTSLPDNSPGFTILVVAKYDNASLAGFLVFPTNTAASDYSWSFGRSGANSMSVRGYHGTPGNQASFNDNTTTTQLLSGIATTTLRQIWEHGTSEATNTGTDSANTAGRIYIGSDNNPTSFLDGRIAEIIIIEGTDATIRQKAEGYLAWEWGLVSDLDAGHPYKSTPP